LAYQGQFYVACVTPTNLGNGQTLGRVVLKYKCHFYTPSLESPVVLGTTQFIGTPSGANANLAADLIASASGLNYNIGVSGAGTIEGPFKNNGTWTPTLTDPSGNPALISAIKLGQGLYNLTMAVVNAADHAQNGAGTGTFVPVMPVLTALESLPAQGPQPMIATNETLVGTAQGTATYWTGAFADFLCSIPRGGAWLQAGLAYTLANFNTLASPTFTMNLRRLKGFEDISGLHIGRPGKVLAIGWAQCSGREPPTWDGRSAAHLERHKALYATSPRATKWVGQSFTTPWRFVPPVTLSRPVAQLSTEPVFLTARVEGGGVSSSLNDLDKKALKEKKRALKRKELLDMFRDMRMQIVDQLRDEMSQVSDGEIDMVGANGRVLPALTTA